MPKHTRRSTAEESLHRLHLDLETLGEFSGAGQFGGKSGEGGVNLMPTKADLTASLVPEYFIFSRTLQVSGILQGQSAQSPVNQVHQLIKGALAFGSKWPQEQRRWNQRALTKTRTPLCQWGGRPRSRTSSQGRRSGPRTADST